MERVFFNPKNLAKIDLPPCYEHSDFKNECDSVGTNPVAGSFRTKILRVMSILYKYVTKVEMMDWLFSHTQVSHN